MGQPAARFIDVPAAAGEYRLAHRRSWVGGFYFVRCIRVVHGIYVGWCAVSFGWREWRRGATCAADSAHLWLYIYMVNSLEWSLWAPEIGMQLVRRRARWTACRVCADYFCLIIIFVCWECICNIKCTLRFRIIIQIINIIFLKVKIITFQPFVLDSPWHYSQRSWAARNYDIDLFLMLSVIIKK